MGDWTKLPRWAQDERQQLTREVRDLRRVIDGLGAVEVEGDTLDGFVGLFQVGGAVERRIINAPRIEGRVRRGPHGPQCLEMSLVPEPRAADVGVGLRIQGRHGQVAVLPTASNSVTIQERD